MEEEREIDGRGVESVVEQAFSHLQRCGVVGVVVVAAVFGTQSVKYKFVLAQSLDGQFVVVLELLLNIVGIKHGEFCRLRNVLVAEREQIGIGPHENTEVAEPGGNAAECLFREAHRVLLLYFVEINLGIGQIFLQTLAHAYRTAAGTAAAVGRGEGLVQIDVHHVEAHIARSANAHHRVEVCAVVVHQAAAFMHEPCNFWNIFFKNAERVGVRHHHAGDVVAEFCAQVFDVHGALRSALYLHDLQTAYGGGSRVSAVRRVGHNDFHALVVASALVVGADHHKAGQFAVCPGIGIEGKGVHAAHFGQHGCEVVIQMQAALQRFCGLRWVHVGKAGQGGDFFVDFGIILHRATAQGVEARVYAEVVARHICIMACRREFVHFGQGSGRVFAQQVGGQLARFVFILPQVIAGQRITFASLARKFEYQRSI